MTARASHGGRIHKQRRRSARSAPLSSSRQFVIARDETRPSNEGIDTAAGAKLAADLSNSAFVALDGADVAKLGLAGIVTELALGTTLSQ